ncbi:MAG: NADH-quinone oxidoreductase subunit D [Candidatus Firestonebacteria bacterium]
MKENPIITTDNCAEFEEMTLNMGPQHPSTHGVFHLLLKMNGETITYARPDIGYLHRGMEKLAEKRTYQANIAMSDRWDYIAAMSNNFAAVLGPEKLMKVQVPKRAEYIRVIMAELNRIASHLIFFGTYGIDIGAFTPFFYAFRDREKILDLFESVSGARLTFNYFRIGGVAQDLPADFIANTKEFIRFFRPKLKEYDTLLSQNVIFRDRTVGVGAVSAEEAVNWAWSGPNLRGSGVNFDIRKDDTYSVYSEFDFAVPTGANGDCWDRYMVRMKEMYESTVIIEQALAKIPEGEIMAKVPRVIKPPAGEIYIRIEAPKGDLGVYLISDGSVNPYRMKVRGPSFVNVAILQKILKGWKIADVVAVLGSLDIVLGEVDR